MRVASGQGGVVLELFFPIEFNVRGTPVSLQASQRRSKEQWKEKVKAASLSALPDQHFATGAPIAVTLFYFAASRVTGDIDNIVKLVLDAMARHIYLDDAQVERVVVQKFEPGNVYPFREPNDVLAEAMAAPKPILYVKLSDNPFEELV